MLHRDYRTLDPDAPLRPSVVIPLLLLLGLVHSGAVPKLYLTPNESALLFPQLYIDQTVQTRYEILGSGFAVHPAL